MLSRLEEYEIHTSPLQQFYSSYRKVQRENVFLYGKEEFEKMNYKPEEPTLQGLIKYCKNFNIPGWRTAILGKNNNLLKITNGK